VKFRYSVVILRHASAFTQGDEMERALTPQGEERVNKLKETLKIDWKHVISSPATRAIQTAFLATGVTPEEWSELYANTAPSSDVLTMITQRIINKSSDGAVLVVTHAPVIGAVIEALVGHSKLGDSFSSGHGVLIQGNDIAKI
jgi:phosphohistidine phosphatase SixA